MSNIDKQLEALALQIELAKANKSKTRYKWLFVVTAISFIVVISYVYKFYVFDYAVLENVKIEKNKYDGITFSFDVVEEGKIDFNYGKYATLSDNFKVANGKSFNWKWQVFGYTDISIKSKKSFLPNVDMKTFFFDKK